jgi:hypothetical protein
MNSLFDVLGQSGRAPAITAALQQLACEGDTGRGAIFTKPAVVNAILDLSGYTDDRPLHRMRALEPSFGSGDFLLAMLDRLLVAWHRSGGQPEHAHAELGGAIRAVELHRDSYSETAGKLLQRLVQVGISAADAEALCSAWLICDDFLLANVQGEFDFIVGNPPYVRQERIPAPLLGEYRSRFSTLYDRADLYVPFYERALDLLGQEGVLGFICANRWLKNRYGGPLRDKISRSFHLTYFLDMEGIDAFHSDVIAYPAITIIHRSGTGTDHPRNTRVALPLAIAGSDLSSMVIAMRSAQVDRASFSEISLNRSSAPWLLDDAPQLGLLRRLEREWPTLEQSGCKVGIGVATGCDRVFIDDFDALPVEPERKLPLVMARDLVDGSIRWRGKGVLNPFGPDGGLVALEQYPLFAAYLHKHLDAVAGRNVAMRNKSGWYRTIDRIYPELISQPKLLVPDIKGEATFVLDEGNYYPHHNLYYIQSATWDLRALQAVLRSSVTVLTVASYCTRMAGGFLRFQAQYLRRIRLPPWSQVSVELRRQLVAAAGEREQSECDAPVFRLYGLSADEADQVSRFAANAQVTLKNRKDSQ